MTCSKSIKVSSWKSKGAPQNACLRQWPFAGTGWNCPRELAPPHWLSLDTFNATTPSLHQLSTSPQNASAQESASNAGEAVAVGVGAALAEHTSAPTIQDVEAAIADVEKVTAATITDEPDTVGYGAEAIIPYDPNEFLLTRYALEARQEREDQQKARLEWQRKDRERDVEHVVDMFVHFGKLPEVIFLFSINIVLKFFLGNFPRRLWL